MPPKQRYTHEIILDKAYEMFLADGMEAVNARSVSKALNCSTQPIFSYFPDMNGLRSALIEKGMLEFSSAMEDASLLNHSVVARCQAYVNFASRQSKVFNFLVSQQKKEINPAAELLAVPSETLAAEKEATGLSEDVLKSVFDRLNTYTAGLAFLVASGIEAYQEEKVEEELIEVYSALIRAV